MSFKSIALMSILISTCFLYGCQQPHLLDKSAVMVSATKQFSELDSQSEHTLKKDELFDVVLSGNPSTGYVWQLELDTQQVITQTTESTYVATENPEGRVGSGGQHIFHLRAATTGKAVITFKYLRPWEHNMPAANVIHYRLTVQ